MTYSVNDVVCDYGVYENINGNRRLCVICNNRANALLVADILNKDYEHQIADMRGEQMEIKINKQFIDEAVQKAVEELKENNIWIPDGMTNREIISEFVERDDSFAIMIDEVNGTVNIELSLDFWNACYKAESEEE